MDQGVQIRGWKEIAAAISTSERTARRWERTRGLPVRRHAGDRDAVYLLRDELDKWLRTGDPEPANAPHDVVVPSGDNRREATDAQHRFSWLEPSTSWPAAAKRWSLVAVATALLAYLVTWWATGGLRARPAAVPPVKVDTFTLRVSRPDGWTSVLTIADGGAGQFGGVGEQPMILLRPRRIAAGLMLEIDRADGRPVTNRPNAPGPPVLLLEPNVMVGVSKPFRFDLEWMVSEGRTP